MKIILSAFSSRSLAETASFFNTNCLYSFDYFADEDLKEYVNYFYSLKKDKNAEYKTEFLYSQLKRFLLINQNDIFYFVYGSDWDNQFQLLEKLSQNINLIIKGNSPNTLKRLAGEKGLLSLFNLIKKTDLKRPAIIFKNDPFAEKDFSKTLYLKKPLAGGGGKNIEIVTKPAKYSADNRLQIVDGFYLQEYIKGESYSVQFAADGKKAKILSFCRQLNAFNSKSSFKYGGNILVKPDNSTINKITKAANLLVENYSLKGINGFDYIQNDDGLYFLELNPRYTAAVELLIPIFGRELFAVYFKDQLKKDYLNDYLNTELKASGKVIYYAEEKIKIKYELRREFKKIYNRALNNKFKNVEVKIKDIPTAGEVFNKKDPVFTLIIKSKNEDQFWQVCSYLFSEIEKSFLSLA
ncbi:MAG: ATP-grasp domain-containing protein [Halanaerobium sp.]